MSDTEQEFEKLKEGFLATVSHELRTPLNGILGLAGALQQIETNDQKRKQLGVVTNSAQAMLGLVTAIIDMHSLSSKNLRLTLASENLDTLVQECVDFARTAVDKRGKPLRKDAVRLNFEPGNIASLEIDRSRMHKAILAIIDNSLKFTAQGVVTVRTKTAGLSHVVIEVSDTGVGIEKAALDKIFRTFEQGEEDHLNRKFEGLGLGLSVASEIVKLHGGEISVFSEITKGSTFTLKFPIDTRAAYEARLRLLNEQVQTAKAGSTEALATQAAKEFGSGEILLVEPDISCHLAIDRIFRPVAIKVAAVASKVEALQYLRTHAAPDACVVSEASEWREILQTIRGERSPTIPIFVMSGNFNEKTAREAATLLATGVVKKPVQVEDERNFFELVMSGIRQRFLVQAEFKRRTQADVMRQVLPDVACKKISAGASEYVQVSDLCTFVHVKVDAAEIFKTVKTPSAFAALFSQIVDLFEDGAIEAGLQVTGVAIGTFTAIADSPEKAVRFLREFLLQVEKQHPQVLPYFRAAAHSGPGANLVVGGRMHAPHFVAVPREGEGVLVSLAASSLPGRLHLSQSTKEALAREFGETGVFDFQARGELDIAGERVTTFILKKKTTEDLSHVKLAQPIGAGEAVSSSQPGAGWVSAEVCVNYLAPLERLVEQLSGLVDSTGGESGDHPLVNRILDLETDLEVLVKSLDGQELKSSGASEGRLRGALGRSLRDGQLMELQEEFDFLQRNFRFLLDDWRAVNNRLRRVQDEHGNIKAEISDLRESASVNERSARQTSADQRHAEIIRGDRAKNYTSRGYLAAAVGADPELGEVVSKYANIISSIIA